MSRHDRCYSWAENCTCCVDSWCVCCVDLCRQANTTSESQISKAIRKIFILCIVFYTSIINHSDKHSKSVAIFKWINVSIEDSGQSVVTSLNWKVLSLKAMFRFELIISFCSVLNSLILIHLICTNTFPNPYHKPHQYSNSISFYHILPDLFVLSFPQLLYTRQLWYYLL